MALRSGLVILSNIRCAVQQGIRLRAMSTQTAAKETETEAPKPGQTHFGFQVVDEGEKSKKVHEVFETVAEKYDLMNDVMSMGIHRVWKDIFMQRLAPRQETKLLDMAGGTGDIAFRYIKYLQSLGPSHAANSSVTVCDINQAMLDVGKQRAQKLGFTPEGCGVAIDWVCGDAEKLHLPDDSYDAYTIAFGIRNCTHVDKVLEEAYRVLTPGGRFMCLEFSQLPNSTLQWVYDQYSFQVIPVLGQLFAGQWKPYQYLVESIRQFPNQENFKTMIEDAGFRQVLILIQRGRCVVTRRAAHRQRSDKKSNIRKGTLHPRDKYSNVRQRSAGAVRSDPILHARPLRHPDSHLQPSTSNEPNPQWMKQKKMLLIINSHRVSYNVERAPQPRAVWRRRVVALSGLRRAATAQQSSTLTRMLLNKRL